MHFGIVFVEPPVPGGVPRIPADLPLQKKGYDESGIHSVINEYYEDESGVCISLHLHKSGSMLQGKEGKADLTWLSLPVNMGGLRIYFQPTGTVRSQTSTHVSPFPHSYAAIMLTTPDPRAFNVQGADQTAPGDSAGPTSNGCAAPSRPPSRAQNRSPMGKLTEWATNDINGTALASFMLNRSHHGSPQQPLPSCTAGLKG